MEYSENNKARSYVSNQRLHTWSIRTACQLRGPANNGSYERWTDRWWGPLIDSIWPRGDSCLRPVVSQARWAHCGQKKGAHVCQRWSGVSCKVELAKSSRPKRTKALLGPNTRRNKMCTSRPLPASGSGEATGGDGSTVACTLGGRAVSGMTRHFTQVLTCQVTRMRPARAVRCALLESKVTGA